MTNQLVTLLAAAALAACSSKSPAKPTTPEPVGSGSAVVTPEPEPARPVEPAPPVEPPTPDPAAVKAELLAGEMSAYDKAKPVFEKFCASCHTKAGKKAAKKKLDHFDMTMYPFGGHHTATIGFTIRDVLGISGKKPTMPDNKPGSVQGDELATIKAWTDAWEAAEQGGAHPPAAGHGD